MEKSAIDRNLPRGTLIIAKDKRYMWKWAILDQPSYIDDEAFLIFFGEDNSGIHCFPSGKYETGASGLIYHIIKPRNNNEI